MASCPGTGADAPLSSRIGYTMTVTRNLHKFSGKKEEAVLYFLVCLESLLEITDDGLMDILKSTLEGGALMWYLGLAIYDRTHYFKFRYRFLERYIISSPTPDQFNYLSENDRLFKPKYITLGDEVRSLIAENKTMRTETMFDFSQASQWPLNALKLCKSQDGSAVI